MERTYNTYRLIKEYPNSEKLNSIFTYKVDVGKYGTGNKISGAWDNSYFQGWPEYYEIVENTIRDDMQEREDDLPTRYSI